MLPKNRIATHPGEVLGEDFLKPAGLSQAALARHIQISAPYLGDILHGKRAISAKMAWRLAKALGTSPEFWMNLQAAYDLTKVRDQVPNIKRLTLRAR